jgi:hypothetical protein
MEFDNRLQHNLEANAFKVNTWVTCLDN